MSEAERADTQQRLVSVITQLLVALTKEDRPECDWYEGLEEDAIAKAEALLQDIENQNRW